MKDKLKIINKIIELLSKHNCLQDIAFYYDDTRIHTFDGELKTEFINISDYLPEYFDIEDYYIYMTFEGQFYDVINYGHKQNCYIEFDKLLEDNKLYFELGEYWNMMIRI